MMNDKKQIEEPKMRVETREICTKCRTEKPAVPAVG